MERRSKAVTNRKAADRSRSPIPDDDSSGKKKPFQLSTYVPLILVTVFIISCILMLIFEPSASSSSSSSSSSSNTKNIDEVQNNNNNNINLRMKSEKQETTTERENDNDNDKDGMGNPYYGWQAVTADKMECSWRKCFKDDHTCKTCRDSKTDMGEAPPRPPPPVGSGSDEGTTWIPDVSMLHRMMMEGKDSNGKPFPPPLDEELCERIGTFGGKGDDNFNVIEKIKMMDYDHKATTAPKLFCGVYTMEKAHGTSIRAIRDTWGNLCDGFLAFSTADDPRIPAISLPHKGPEEYQNMWQKIRSIWHFVGTHYIDEFDFFFLGGDDLFVIPQNLKHYLKNYLEEHGTTSDEPHFLGRRFKGYGENNYFNSGGAGYTLSRGTLRKYVTEGFEHPECAPDRHTSMEDVMIAKCLRDAFNIPITDTRNENGSERFHPFSPGTHYGWRPPRGGKDWYEDYNKEWPPKLGFDCCAPDSVSFHYIKKPAMVRHLFALLNNCRK